MTTQAETPDSSERSLAGTKILIVDDEKDTVGLAKLVLENAGAEIFCAYNGEELWEGLDDERWGFPDLILLDLKMPLMDGIEVCKKLKKDSKFRKIPILVFTAKISRDARKEATLAGAGGYITKPFVAKNLPPKIKEMIDNAKEESKGEENTTSASPKS
ncbi:MAG: response regulator [Candidatus Thorarchaeota archaeon]